MPAMAMLGERPASAGKAVRVAVSALPTAGFDHFLSATKEICPCPSQPNDQSWPQARETGEVGLVIGPSTAERSGGLTVPSLRYRQGAIKGRGEGNGARSR